MQKMLRFLPQVYMISTMTFSVSMVHYLLGHSDNFWVSWGAAVIIAAPLALFFSRFIGPMMRVASKKMNVPEHGNH